LFETKYSTTTDLSSATSVMKLRLTLLLSRDRAVRQWVHLSFNGRGYSISDNAQVFCSVTSIQNRSSDFWLLYTTLLLRMPQLRSCSCLTSRTVGSHSADSLNVTFRVYLFLQNTRTVIWCASGRTIILFTGPWRTKR